MGQSGRPLAAVWLGTLVTPPGHSQREQAARLRNRVDPGAIWEMTRAWQGHRTLYVSRPRGEGRGCARELRVTRGHRTARVTEGWTQCPRARVGRERGARRGGGGGRSLEGRRRAGSSSSSLPSSGLAAALPGCSVLWTPAAMFTRAVSRLSRKRPPSGKLLRALGRGKDRVAGSPGAARRAARTAAALLPARSVPAAAGAQSRGAARGGSWA